MHSRNREMSEGDGKQAKEDVLYEYRTIRKEESSPAATHIQIEALYGHFR